MTIKRVAMLSVHTCPLAMLGGKETGGMNVYVRELTTELDRQGITVDVFTRSQEPGTPIVHGILGQRSRVIHVPAGPERPYNKNKVYQHLPEFVNGVRQRAIREGLQYDVIHSHYWLSGMVARDLQCIWGGTPVVQMFHTLGHMKNMIAQSPAELESSLRIVTERQLMNLSDRLIAATPLEKNQLIECYEADPSKIDIAPPGVNLNLFQPLPRAEALQHLGLPPDRKLILFVGRIQPLKGIDTLIKALALAIERHPDLRQKVTLSIIGGAPNPDSDIEQAELEKLHRLQAELGIGDVVSFLGAKDQNTLVYYYAAAQMVVMPSHYESFGMVAIEAMACATPVIASRVGGLTYSIEDGFNGYLVPREDPQALADKIALLLRYPSLRDQLGEQALRWVKRFSWQNIAADVLKIYQRAIDEKNRIPCP
jgi:D-inositol-3-phosphate glycosyltransferase